LTSRSREEDVIDRNGSSLARWRKRLGNSSRASLTLVFISTGFALAEEIIVTAQKVPENILEVPISMTVLDDEVLRREGVTGLDDAARLIPNFSVFAGSFGTTARMRGFDTGIVNKGFEPAVGFLLDGVIYGRKQYLDSALYDLERIEVLRGPQGTLFGKNNSAGLVQIRCRARRSGT
jgi:iron complex outermembrane receptor protein